MHRDICCHRSETEGNHISLAQHSVSGTLIFKMQSKSGGPQYAQRILAVLHIICHIFDALLHPHLLLFQLSLPLLQILNLSLQFNQLVGNFTSVTARAYTSGKKESLLMGYEHVTAILAHSFPVIHTVLLFRYVDSKCFHA